MADYWKSMDKKYCDVCKCWLTDNKASIAFHENGNRHKLNIQNRIKEIHKKNKAEQKSDRKMESEMKKIEQAALAASKKDQEENPDVSMKIQTYIDKLKEDGESSGTASSEKTEKKSNQPTILHRSDKQKKVDESLIKTIEKADKDYDRMGGWKMQENERERAKAAFLELPSASTKTPGVSLLLAAKAEEEEPIAFAEKTVSNSSSSSRLGVKLEDSEVAFKKRKISRGNVRRRDEDD